MSYYEIDESNPLVRMGRDIYMKGLSGRRGFRYDQLGIDEKDDWEDIFTDLAYASQEYVSMEFEDIVAWECKDFADGWIRFTNIHAALAYQRETGCIMRPVWK